MDLNLVTIKSYRVLKNKLARSVGGEWLGTYSNKNQPQFADNLLRTHRKFSKFQWGCFCFDSHQIGLRVIFHWFSENFLPTLRNISVNFVPYGKYSDLSFLYGPQFIRFVRQNCSPSILPYGPHSWLIRA